MRPRATHLEAFCDMPRKVKTPKIVLKYADDPDSKERMQQAYNLIFDLARKELTKKRHNNVKKDKG